MNSEEFIKSYLMEEMKMRQEIMEVQRRIDEKEIEIEQIEKNYQQAQVKRDLE
jgi:hypothetical protein